MSATHFNPRAGGPRPILPILFFLAAALGGAVYLGAQDTDSPITISDGSLTLEAGVPWSNFNAGGARNRRHPDGGRSVTQVAITMPGNNQTFPFSAQKCTVTVRYSSTDVTVTTGNNGKGLQVNTDFSAFHGGGNARQLLHNNASAKISHVTVTRGTETIFNSDASGGTKIVISYRR